jgi:hypothetical protein
MLHNEMLHRVMLQGRRKKGGYKSKTMLPVPEDQWYRVEGTHEAIIDRETVRAEQRSLKLRSKADGYRREAHLLSGLL